MAEETRHWSTFKSQHTYSLHVNETPNQMGRQSCHDAGSPTTFLQRTVHIVNSFAQVYVVFLVLSMAANCKCTSHCSLLKSLISTFKRINYLFFIWHVLMSHEGVKTVSMLLCQSDDHIMVVAQLMVTFVGHFRNTIMPVIRQSVTIRYIFQETFWQKYWQ